VRTDPGPTRRAATVARREAARNLRRSPAAAMACGLACAVSCGLVAVAVEWLLVVRRAVVVVAGYGPAVSVHAQRRLSGPLVVVALVGGAIVVAATVGLATGRRRRSELDVLERLLGAPARYTSAPALLEGAAEGAGGGVVAAGVAVVGAPSVAHAERSTLPGGYLHVVRQIGLPTQQQVVRFDLGAIHLAAADTILVALGAAGLATLLGVAATAATLQRRGRRPPDDDRPA
jgi:cell division protein FtsX